VQIESGSPGRECGGDSVSVLLVILGAAAGAPLRYLTDRAVQARHDTVFAWGTLTVYVVGSLVLGLLTGAVLAGVAPQEIRLAVGVGLCGTPTTYSTFSLETLWLLDSRSVLPVVANVW
jgi:CrcB protein